MNFRRIYRRSDRIRRLLISEELPFPFPGQVRGSSSLIASRARRAREGKCNVLKFRGIEFLVGADYGGEKTIGSVVS